MPFSKICNFQTIDITGYTARMHVSQAWSKKQVRQCECKYSFFRLNCNSFLNETELIYVLVQFGICFVFTAILLGTYVLPPNYM